MKTSRSAFTTVQTQGAILPADLLQRVSDLDRGLDGLTPTDYHFLPGEKLNEAISRSWNRLTGAWAAFKAAWGGMPEGDHVTKLTLDRWQLVLFQELGYGHLMAAQPVTIDEKIYTISHMWSHAPIHLVGAGVPMDRAYTANGAKMKSPHSLLQEFLNRSDNHLWGFVSNGLTLRILRDNKTLTRQSYVEFDLQTMMEGEAYADFALMWLLCHESRVEGDKPEQCWLEKWSKVAHEQGVRMLDQLRGGVEKAITSLGRGFLAHPANGALKAKLQNGDLNKQDYYRQVLRLVYRLIFLFVAEDRELLLDPKADQGAKERYQRFYSVARLRRLAERRGGTAHGDLFQGLRLVMTKLDQEGAPALALPALGSFLWSTKAVPDLLGCEISNRELLEAIRALAFTETQRVRRPVDYKNLDSDEFGSVYESLLELHPDLDAVAGKFELRSAAGNERKSTGSYYTPTSLISCLLDSALDPVLDEAARKPDAEKAILALKVCDPACGSGHFLIAAAHRIAKRLAAVRTGNDEPSPEDTRHALRDVVSHCIYGVDANEMAVELCRVNLWMDAIDPGRPLSFLDHRIRLGNSLLGTTPALLAKGIPDEAFTPIEGDDKKVCTECKKRNKREREGRQMTFLDKLEPWERLGDLASAMMDLDSIDDGTIEGLRKKQEQWETLASSTGYKYGRLLADAWCAAFVWKKIDTPITPAPITEDVIRRIERNPHDVNPAIVNEIRRLAEQYQFHHWHLAFPDVFRVPAKEEQPENEQTGWSGGFDVLLGNPPWERIKLQEKEWFASRHTGIANAPNAAQRRKLIAALEIEQPALHAAFLEDCRSAEGESQLVRNTGRFPLCGRGDVNTYAVFAETFLLLVSLNGRAGMIVPSGIATDDTTKFFFQELIESRALVSLYSFENEEFVFPGVHHAFKFCLLTITGKAKPIVGASNFFFFARSIDALRDTERHIFLSDTDLKSINPNTSTCPIFRRKRDADITKSIYRRVPVLIKEGPPEENPWGISFTRMIDMTNDSSHFRTRDHLEGEGWRLVGNRYLRGSEVYLPLYEAKMIQQFDHRFGDYSDHPPDTQTTALPQVPIERLQDPYYAPLPRYWVPASLVSNALSGSWTREWLLMFRSITNATNERTTISTVTPLVGAGNSAPVMIVGKQHAHLACILASNLSSFALDFVSRLKVGGTNFNFFIVNQLAILPPETYLEPAPWSSREKLSDWITERALELAYTTWDLQPFAKDSGFDGPPFNWDEEKRFNLRCELDAAFFHLYGLERSDVDYIMDTFNIVMRKDVDRWGEYRTKRLIVELFDAMQRAIETGQPYLSPSLAQPVS